MPQLGLEMEEGTVLDWHYEVDDPVEEGDVIAEVESDKSIGEIDAREDGVIREILVNQGDTVSVGTPIGIFAKKDEDIKDLQQEAKSQQPELSSDTNKSSNSIAEKEKSIPKQSTEQLVSPRARRAASELGVDLESIEGSGPQDSIIEADVVRAAESTKTSSPPIQEERTIDGMRQTIAERLGKSYREAIHVTEHRDVNAEQMLTAIDTTERAFEKDISITDIILCAVSATLNEYPEFNATFEDGDHRIYSQQNICMAVDVDQGLITPVIRDVASRDFENIISERSKIIDQATTGEYTMDDLRGGTFTISNLGVLGIDSFNPIINPPQVAILGINRVRKQAVENTDGDLSMDRFIGLDLTFDHRVLDGADAARFLETLTQHLENPWPLMPETVAKPKDSIILPERRLSVQTEGGVSGVINAGSFEWTFDEPPKVGGEGSAPTPVDFFLGSFAACLSASIGLQAKKRDIELRQVEITVEGSPKEMGIDHIEVSIGLIPVNEVDDETLERVVKVGERGCYVSNVISDDLPVEIDWHRSTAE